MKRVASLLVFSMLIFITGCASGETQANNQGNYEETKKMVVDILKTDEGKKAIKDLIKDNEIKESLVMEQTFVKETIQSSLTSEEAEKFWKKAFEDPKFAESFAKSMKKEHEELIKNLMKDPDYQKSLLEILQDPQMEKEIIEAMKSQEFREEIKTVITETFESPLFKAKIQELLIKGAEEIEKKQGGKEEEGKEGEGKEGKEGE